MRKRSGSMNSDTQRTIAAISTAYGESGIGIVRMSGPKAKEIASRIFLPYKYRNASENQKQTPSGAFEFRDRLLHYGHVADPKTNEVIDEVLCVYMKAPHTYTGDSRSRWRCRRCRRTTRSLRRPCR